MKVLLTLGSVATFPLLVDWTLDVLTELALQYSILYDVKKGHSYHSSLYIDESVDTKEKKAKKRHRSLSLGSSNKKYNKQHQLKVNPYSSLIHLTIQQRGSKERQGVQIIDDYLLVDWIDSLPRKSFLDLLSQQDVIIAHAGAGTVLDVFRSKTHPWLVIIPNPSLKDNHQEELADAVKEYCWIIRSKGDLYRVIKRFLKEWKQRNVVEDRGNRDLSSSSQSSSFIMSIFKRTLPDPDLTPLIKAILQ